MLRYRVQVVFVTRASSKGSHVSRSVRIKLHVKHGILIGIVLISTTYIGSIIRKVETVD